MNKQPKYRQVADVLRREIDNGTYAPGSRLPSENDLQQRFDASRNTIRSGLSLLVSEGLISSSQGLGYEVKSHEVFELNASRFENLTFPQNGDAYSTDVTNAGRRPHQTFRVEMLPASQEIAQRLRIDAGYEDGVAVLSSLCGRRSLVHAGDLLSIVAGRRVAATG